MKRVLPLAAVATAVVLLAAACGGDDDGDDTSAGDGDARTVEIDMVDIAFEPDSLEVRTGETVRFLFTNSGEIDHDAFIGDTEAQAEHEMEMNEGDDDGHGGGHGEEPDDAVTVEPGDTGELTYTFHDAGSFEIGCHQPGHYEGGMKVDVEVA